MRNYGGKSPVSIKYENLYSFKKGVILLCQSILETRRISHLHGSVLFAVPLKVRDVTIIILMNKSVQISSKSTAKKKVHNK